MNFADISVVVSESLPHTATGPIIRYFVFATVVPIGPVILISIQSLVPYHAYISSPPLLMYTHCRRSLLLSIANKMPQRLLLQHFDLSSVNRYPIGAPSFRMVLIQLTLLGISVCIAICKPMLNFMIFFIIILLCPFSH